MQKKRIGPARNDSNRPLFYKKDIGVLARAGFDFETSKKIMDLDSSEYSKIINKYRSMQKLDKEI